MRVLVIGGGGREHALIKALKKSREITALYALPGNGGIAAEAVCVGIPVTDTDAVIAYIKAEQIGFVVVAPDDPLAAGMVNALHAAGIPCFGPEKAAAAIESSKVFAKELMQKYNIPTAKYQVFCFSKDALSYVEQCDYPVVIKADGLALGKGVVIASTQEEAKAAINEIMVERKFGESGSRIVIEECLTGPEVSVLTFTDGHCIKPMVSSMDHKRAQDNDLGPNTGGMGTVAPNPYYTKDIAARCMEEIFLPTMRAMNAEGAPFKGCLYFGLMLTKDGPKVIEYNCRFGDPETQVVLPLLESDLFRVMRAVEEERLSDVEVVNKPGAACCVIVASAGYPKAYEKGKPITLPSTDEEDGMYLYHAGTALNNGQLVTAGGRVLGAAAVAEALPEAISRAYALAEQVQFEGAYYRKDIGRRALAAATEE